MMVTVEMAKVWRAGRRRFFTRRGAYMYLARQRIKRACECLPGQYGDFGRCEIEPEYCRFHALMGRDKKELPVFSEGVESYGEIVLRRLARWYRFCDSKGAQP